MCIRDSCPPVHAKCLVEISRCPARKRAWAVDAKIGHLKVHFPQATDIGAQKLGIIGHHRAVIAVIAQPFVEIICKAWIEYRIYPFFD